MATDGRTPWTVGEPIARQAVYLLIINGINSLIEPVNFLRLWKAKETKRKDDAFRSGPTRGVRF
jgi:hypothetical protein